MDEILWRVLYKVNMDSNIWTKTLFTDEAQFYVNEEINRQNLRYRCNENLIRLSPIKM